MPRLDGVRYLCHEQTNEPVDMKTLWLIPLAALVLATAAACSPADDPTIAPPPSEQPDTDVGDDEDYPDDDNNDSTMQDNTIRITVQGGSTFTVTLEQNTATEALKARLASGDVTLLMNDYGNMEKVGSLGFSLPRNDTRITTSPGVLVLYQGNMLVLFYGSNTWSYTPLGKVDGVDTRDGMLNLLGGAGDVTLTLSAER